MKRLNSPAAAILAALAVLMLSGCTDPCPPPTPGMEVVGDGKSVSVVKCEITDDLAPTFEVDTLIRRYRWQLREELEEVVGQAGGQFEKGTPEGTLGNLAADALLYAARLGAADTVHLALVNRGGLRIPLAPGPIRMRHVYELLPFENAVVVLPLTGAEIERLADQLAASGGEPIAGWTMEIEGDSAVDVRLDGQPLLAHATYRLATVDYLANGGGRWSQLWEPEETARETLDMLIRDAFALYLRDRSTVHPTLEGRVRTEESEANRGPSP